LPKTRTGLAARRHFSDRPLESNLDCFNQSSAVLLLNSHSQRRAKRSQNSRSSKEINVRSTGERVVVDGDCLSACTLVLGLVPSNQVCATPRARFGFHVASILNNAGQRVASAIAAQALWNVYPASVQRWG
jgi:hypothetical protein